MTLAITHEQLSVAPSLQLLLLQLLNLTIKQDNVSHEAEERIEELESFYSEEHFRKQQIIMSKLGMDLMFCQEMNIELVNRTKYLEEKLLKISSEIHKSVEQQNQMLELHYNGKDQSQELMERTVILEGDVENCQAELISTRKLYENFTDSDLNQDEIKEDNFTDQANIIEAKLTLDGIQTSDWTAQANISRELVLMNCTEREELLLEAAESGNLTTVRSLVELSTNLSVRNWLDLTPLHLAVRNGHADIVSVLLDAGANISAAYDAYRKSPLHLAAEEGHLRVAEVLIDAGANINILDYRSSTPLHYTAQNGHVEVAKVLVEAGAKLSSKEIKYGQTPLHIGANQGHVNIIQLLLNAGANVEAKSDRGQTPLHDAAFMGHVQVARMLLSAGAKLEAKNHVQQTPLFLATYMGREEMTRMLMDAGANLFARSANGCISLHKAADIGNLEVVRILLYADFEERGNWKQICEASNDHFMKCRLMRYSSEQMSTRDEINRTPLHHAAYNGHLSVVKFLVYWGADSKVKDKLGRTPRELALFNGKWEVEEWLRKLY